MSMLELLDVINEELTLKGEEPIAFEHDCREGICGSCGFMINGIAHGPLPATTVCQLSMRHFKDGDDCISSRGAPKHFRSSRTWWWTAAPSIASLIAGGYISIPTGSAPDGNVILVPKEDC